MTFDQVSTTMLITLFLHFFGIAASILDAMTYITLSSELKLLNIVYNSIYVKLEYSEIGCSQIRTVCQYVIKSRVQC